MQLQPLVEAIRSFDAKRLEYEELRKLVRSSGEPEMIAMAQEELEATIAGLQEIESTIALHFAKPDAADAAAAIMEIRPAAGGLEAGLFAAEMFEAYKQFVLIPCALMGWNFSP